MGTFPGFNSHPRCLSRILNACKGPVQVSTEYRFPTDLVHCLAFRPSHRPSTLLDEKRPNQYIWRRQAQKLTNH